MNNVQLHIGKSEEILKQYEDNCIDSIVTDPPYGISFMNNKWDADVPSVEIWKQCFRVLKPGGHLLSFAGTRTQHKMASNIEEAGFEIRDMIAWVYGSGFPKSLNLQKAIQKKIDAEHIYAPFVSSIWNGWGTNLKPALEPITVARKPISEQTLTKNVMKHATGGINIDGCRIPLMKGENTKNAKKANNKEYIGGSFPKEYSIEQQQHYNLGRFPANFIHDDSDENLFLLKHASRYFYCPKINKRDRDEGISTTGKVRTFKSDDALGGAVVEIERKNTHPTIKPTELMRYLVRLVTPPQGTVLDPFMGSGSTGKACILEGFNFVGIDMSEEYVNIARERIDFARNHTTS